MQHLLTGFELDQDGYLKLIGLAQSMKADPKAYRDCLQGMSAALLFEKPSLRTRTTFELAMYNLGGHGVYLGLEPRVRWAVVRLCLTMPATCRAG